MALASPAQAATVGVASVVSSTVVQFKAAGRATNKVVVTRSGNTVTIDDRVAVKAGPGCKPVKKDKTRVTCKLSKAPTRLRVWTYDLADSITNRTSLPLSASGGSGNDVITGGSAADAIYGGAGNDSIHGHAGNDAIYGDAGNDTIHGYDGNDAIYGGAGNDTIHGHGGNDSLYGGDGNDT
ncbi:MAG TPA: calcium-binding protein, partial [Actinoplanes sp.]|nr:calcium-binding protein [Actinoplanes sp.]